MSDGYGRKYFFYSVIHQCDYSVSSALLRNVGSVRSLLCDQVFNTCPQSHPTMLTTCCNWSCSINKQSFSVSRAGLLVSADLCSYLLTNGDIFRSPDRCELKEPTWLYRGLFFFPVICKPGAQKALSC